MRDLSRSRDGDKRTNCRRSRLVTGQGSREVACRPGTCAQFHGQLAILFSGDPGVFRPAYLETLGRWWTPPHPQENPLETLFNRLLPAQVYVPTRNAAAFSEIAESSTAGRSSRIVRSGLSSNAYDLRTGQAVLFGNDAARKTLACAKSNPRASKSVGNHRGKSDLEEIELQPITAKLSSRRFGCRCTGSIASRRPTLSTAPIIVPASSPSFTR